VPLSASRNVVALAAAVLVAVVVLVWYLGRPEPYTVVARFQDAGQVVKGNQVRIAGATIGTVSDVRLADDGEAELELKIDRDEFDPLHEGTRAVLRNSSLSSIAGRIIVLEPGPNSAPELRDGATIRAEDTRSATDIDQVLNTIDAKGRQYLQALVRGGARAFSGAERQTNTLLARLSPALSQTRRTIDELRSDEPALRQLVASSAAVSSTLADSSGELEQGLESTAVTLRATAAEREALRRTIERGGGFLRRANTAFATTRLLLEEAKPLLREVRPVAPRLATTLRLAEPLTRNAIPLLRNVRQTLPPLSETLALTPTLATRFVPAAQELTRTVRGADPILEDVRLYAPDLASGLLTGFGGKAGGYYDANGHYSRIALTLNSSALPELLRPTLGPAVDLLAPLLGSGLTVPQTGLLNRCPGSATQTGPDGSNPNPAGHSGTCDVKQVPPGGTNAVAGATP
jgi:phospholipid/cholesterol/gamma-HCH transport system substrate-binding protein